MTTKKKMKSRTVSWMVHNFPTNVKRDFFLKAYREGKTAKELLVEVIREAVRT